MAGAYLKAVVPIFTFPLRFAAAAGVLAARARFRMPQAARILRVAASHLVSSDTACTVDVQANHAGGGAASILPAVLPTITVAPPAAPPVVALKAEAGNVDVGDHSYKITITTAVGETEATAKSNVVANDAGNGKNTVPLPVLTDPAATGWKVYRTVAGDGGDHLLVDTVTPATAGGTPAAPTFEDNVADLGLGAAAPAVNTASDGVVNEVALTGADGAPGFHVHKEDEITVDVGGITGAGVTQLCVQVDYVPVD